MKLTVESTAFSQDGTIPSVYTCDGKNVSPPLTWSKGPSGTKSYALISDDPDGAGGHLGSLGCIQHTRECHGIS